MRVHNLHVKYNKSKTIQYKSKTRHFFLVTEVHQVTSLFRRYFYDCVYVIESYSNIDFVTYSEYTLRGDS